MKYQMQEKRQPLHWALSLQISNWIERTAGMKNQEKIFVIGHKNPDTDSICSAIAYCDIKNRTSQHQKFIPKRAGQINEETEYVLSRFGVQPPGYLSNIGTQVKDMDIRMSPDADKGMSLKAAWDIMQENSIVSLPIRDKEGALEGLITIGDIAKTYMDTTDSYLLSRARTQYQKIAETIDGEVIEGNPHGYFIKGRVMVGTANPDKMKEYIEEDDMIIMGDREEDHLQAISQNVSCIIVGLGIQVSENVMKLAHEKDIIIISSPYDTFTIARLINQSIPVRYIMKTENLVTFNTEDFTDDIQDVMIKHRHRAFPVINKKGKCIGTISRRNFLDMHKKQVVLVDHNEIDQAVDNIEKADILEIIDHHKLGTLQTVQPISFRNQPVGCTGTIMYQIYGEQKLEIPPKIAGLLCAAIISDTLMFRSPTCTLQDKMAAGALALIADISIEQFAKEMFRAGSNLKDKSPEEIFYQDYKKFIAEGDICFGVGQISSMDSEELKEIKERLLPFMVSECGRHGVTRVYFMLTDIMTQSTELLFYGEGSREMAENAFKMEPENDAFYLEGVVSRKKQLIPPLMEAAQMSGDYA
jgi:manganese-dependent inorganic pyrophosphatase